MTNPGDKKNISGSKGGSAQASSKLSATSKASSAKIGASAGSSTNEVRDQRQTDIVRIQQQFQSIESRAEFSAVQSAIGNIESAVTRLPVELQQLRDRGYLHAGRLDQRISDLRSQWRSTRVRVDSSVRTRGREIRQEVEETKLVVNRMSVNDGDSIKRADTAVSSLDSQVSAALAGVEGLYSQLQSDLQQIEAELCKVSEMLGVIDASPEITLRDAEGPLACVKAEWEQDGDEGPDGHLLLTDQRLIFEQNEEIVTKKRFGLFASEKQAVQRLLFDVPAYEIESATAHEAGGFLGMGKDDKLELVLGASSPVARARFHLKGQDSDEWVTLIQRVKSGEIDADRHQQFAAEAEAAAELVHAFPTQCPNCFAATPIPPRGARSIVCEFCGAMIKPEVG